MCVTQPTQKSVRCVFLSQYPFGTGGEGVVAFLPTEEGKARGSLELPPDASGDLRLSAHSVYRGGRPPHCTLLFWRRPNPVLALGRRPLSGTVLGWNPESLAPNGVKAPSGMAEPEDRCPGSPWSLLWFLRHRGRRGARQTWTTGGAACLYCRAHEDDGPYSVPSVRTQFRTPRSLRGRCPGHPSTSLPSASTGLAASVRAHWAWHWARGLGPRR